MPNDSTTAPPAANALAAVRERIAEYRYAHGDMPKAVVVSREEYRALLIAFIEVRDFPSVEGRPSELKVHGVPIQIARGPYPWGTFPTHEQRP